MRADERKNLSSLSLNKLIKQQAANESCKEIILNVNTHCKLNEKLNNNSTNTIILRTTETTTIHTFKLGAIKSTVDIDLCADLTSR